MNKKKGALDISPDGIQEIANAFRQSRILLTAFELGIFCAIGDDAKTSSEVAKIIKTDPRATDRLMNALVVLGLLEKQDDTFSNSLETSEFLVEGKPGYMSGLGHMVHLWKTWSTMTDAVKAGTSVTKRERNEEQLKAFIGAMHWRASITASHFVKHLDLSNVKKVLDIGGGSGAYSFAIVRAKEGIKATVFDLPPVCALTREYIEKEKLSGKVDTHEGDFHIDDFGSSYDLILISAIIHMNSPEENVKLIRKAADSLNEGGQIVIQDFIMDENRVHPEHGAFFALNMLVNTKSGDTYTESEIRSWFESCGISDVKRIHAGSDSDLIIGYRSSK